jgi:hypothetical protein
MSADTRAAGMSNQELLHQQMLLTTMNPAKYAFSPQKTGVYSKLHTLLN